MVDTRLFDAILHHDGSSLGLTMCRETIRYMGETVDDTRKVIVGTTSIQIVLRAVSRIALIITCPIANRITLCWGKDAVDQEGTILFAAGSPLILDLQHHGAMVRGPIFAIADAGTNTIGVTEVFRLGEL